MPSRTESSVDLTFSSTRICCSLAGVNSDAGTVTARLPTTLPLAAKIGAPMPTAPEFSGRALAHPAGADFREFFIQLPGGAEAPLRSRAKALRVDRCGRHRLSAEMLGSNGRWRPEHGNLRIERDLVAQHAAGIDLGSERHFTGHRQ